MLNVQTKNLGSVAVVCLQGQIVSSETEILRNAVNFQSEVNAVILDFARVTAVDAGGLGVMLELREQAQSKGIRFELMNVTQKIGWVFAITRLDSVFQITAGVEFFPSVSRTRRVRVGALASCA